MREIKFRGVNLCGKWVYGDLSHNRMCMPDGKLQKYISVCGEPVLPISVGQYTGLKDATGKEIYEGDIVRFKEAYNGVLGDELVHDVVGVVSYVYCEFKIVSNGASELWAPCLMDGVTVLSSCRHAGMSRWSCPTCCRRMGTRRNTAGGLRREPRTMTHDAKIGELLARCYISLSDAWAYANAIERQDKGSDAIKYAGLRRDINTVMELAGRLLKELHDETD